MSFNTYFAAHNKLQTWLDDYNLCLRYCGLTEEDSLCFNHQIKKCNGICAEEEEVVVYNKRAKKILTQYTFDKPNFVIIDKGKMPGEQSLILVENGRYVGYGYMEGGTQINSPEEFKSLIKRAEYYPDADDLLRGWLKQDKKVKTIIL